jgi:hypothetical protein
MKLPPPSGNHDPVLIDAFSIAVCVWSGSLSDEATDLSTVTVFARYFKCIFVFDIYVLKYLSP